VEKNDNGDIGTMNQDVCEYELELDVTKLEQIDFDVLNALDEEVKSDESSDVISENMVNRKY